ncbi:hypothetical protein CRUP_001435 [Coryphaenoides rupestris]|nr:hypothetical protein CRUP_001435 [Coryphaenoides rupestris]
MEIAILVLAGGQVTCAACASGGCHLGTCQMHNLANTLYQISKTTGKDKSKNTHDPAGLREVVHYPPGM